MIRQCPVKYNFAMLVIFMNLHNIKTQHEPNLMLNVM